ncbi:methyl-accepting chemotaxis protein [Montanilutibacter psychrotolerans]|uniref:Methyl-accepting chemotaxis protein n=1 Tax=Montanilutibacter psychrotolerans TaxID=1327343 RepID=A0A3M8SZ36_9GAMM|nr:methyl-accepting chemotaxis protein [Lysobacter psychrotolerans]RNF83792.1 methyl-accepting chemotaxis protein [Lysobacter psychrotolerans]
MKNVTIRQRILLSFAVILVVMLVMGGIALQRLLRIEKEEALLRLDSIPGMHLAGEMESAWHANYVAIHALVGTDDAQARRLAQERLQATHAEFETALGNYEGTITTAQDRENVARVKQATEAYFALEPNLLRLGTTDVAAAGAFMRGSLDPAFGQGEKAIEQVMDYNHATAVEAGKRIDDAVKSAEIEIAATFIGALLLAGLSGFYLLKAIIQPLHLLTRASEVMAKGDFSQRLALARSDEFGVLAQGYDRMGLDLSSLVGQVQTSGIQVNSSINEITATLREQQATAAQIAATTTEIGATSREIAATSKELARTMGAVASGAEQTSLLAGSGQTGLVQMEETMRRVIDATASINAKLAVLTEKADNISQVVTTITKVADQTNLLSLNAAIEAEKAGEYGRGFSVVATEIRRLADQTAVATLDIEQMVREIQSAVSAGVMGMDKFSEEVRRGTSDVQQVGSQLSQVIEHVQAMVPRFEAVNEGVQAQSAGAEQITLALTQLSEAAQQTVDALRQSNQAIDELHQVSAGLRDGVSKFKLQA